MNDEMWATIDGGDPVACVAMRIEREQIDVSSNIAVKPDSSWSTVDAAGHFHAWSDGDDLPTLRREVEHVECGEHGEDCDGLDVVRYLCALCGEEVSPAYVSDSGSKTIILGPRTWEVDVDADLPVGREVSVRIIRGDDEWFGIGLVERSREWDALVRSTVTGAGPLGQRRRSR